MGFVALKVVFLIISQISENLIFFTLRPVTRKRREMLGWAINGEKPGIHRGTNAFGRKLAAGQFRPCFGRPMPGEGDQMRCVSKIMRCSKEQIRPQFSKYRFHNQASHRL